MRQVHYRCEHKTIGKTTHTRDFLYRHANYIARPSADPEFISLGDWDAERAHFLSQASIYQHQAYGVGNQKPTVRANGRLAETILLSLPRQMLPEHRREALNLFAQSITDGGRSRIFISIHRNVPDNPHAHVLLIDRDLITGKPVAMLSASERDRKKAGFSEPNATEYVRLLWENAQNTVFEDYHYDLRADRRSKVRQMAESEELVQAPLHYEIEPTEDAPRPYVPSELYEGEPILLPANPDAPQSTPLPVAEPAPEEELASEPEEDDMQQPLFGVDAVREALHFNERIMTLDGYTRQRDSLREQIAHAKTLIGEMQDRAHADYHELLSSVSRHHAARYDYEQNGRGFMGREKGFRVAAFGYEWKSAGRRQSEALKSEMQVRGDEASQRERAYKEWGIVIPAAEKELAQAEARLIDLEREAMNELKVLGTDHEMETARSIFATQRQQLVNGLNKNDVIDLYQMGELSRAEAHSMLILMGESQLAADLEPEEEMEPEL